MTFFILKKYTPYIIIQQGKGIIYDKRFVSEIRIPNIQTKEYVGPTTIRKVSRI